jgi:hypothetical protein
MAGFENNFWVNFKIKILSICLSFSYIKICICDKILFKILKAKVSKKNVKILL